ncbi:MAG: hypothetical protein LBR58_03945 [Propionibacteriaceae bacterium]|jgi:hypothetical protein|nr:hypothetical protein [Propionibacteriaceae bacterium]
MTLNIEDRLRAELLEAAEPLDVDLDAALDAGQRTLRRRRIAGVASGAVAALAIAAGVGLALPALNNGGDTPAPVATAGVLTGVWTFPEDDLHGFSGLEVSLNDHMITIKDDSGAQQVQLETVSEPSVIAHGDNTVLLFSPYTLSWVNTLSQTGISETYSWLRDSNRMSIYLEYCESTADAAAFGGFVWSDSEGNMGQLAFDGRVDGRTRALDVTAQATPASTRLGPGGEYTFYSVPEFNTVGLQAASWGVQRPVEQIDSVFTIDEFMSRSESDGQAVEVGWLPAGFADLRIQAVEGAAVYTGLLGDIPVFAVAGDSTQEHLITEIGVRYDGQEIVMH